MADATTSSLLPVIVGGLLTLAGAAVVVLGSVVVESRKALQESKKRRADKFEEMVKAVYEFDHWLDLQRDVSFGTVEETLGVSPFAKVQAISAVHFPTLDPLIIQLQSGAARYTLWSAKAQVSRVAGQLLALPPDYQEAIKPYTDARDNLLQGLKAVARDEFR